MVEVEQKRKLSWWWFLAIPFVLLGLLVIQILGPSPTLEQGPKTTVIQAPLRSDGMPNYASYLVGKASQGVTPENNAAPLYWRAMWPGELAPES